jgi:hypothetical protein
VNHALSVTPSAAAATVDIMITSSCIRTRLSKTHVAPSVTHSAAVAPVGILLLLSCSRTRLSKTPVFSRSIKAPGFQLIVILAGAPSLAPVVLPTQVPMASPPVPRVSAPYSIDGLSGAPASSPSLSPMGVPTQVPMVMYPVPLSVSAPDSLGGLSGAPASAPSLSHVIVPTQVYMVMPSVLLFVPAPQCDCDAPTCAPSSVPRSVPSMVPGSCIPPTKTLSICPTVEEYRPKPPVSKK